MVSIFMGKVFTTDKQDGTAQKGNETKYYLSNFLGEDIQQGAEILRKVQHAQKVGYFLLSESSTLTPAVCEAAGQIFTVQATRQLTPASVRRVLVQLKEVSQVLRNTAYWELLLNSNLLLTVSETARIGRLLLALNQHVNKVSPEVLKNNLKYLSTTLIDTLSFNCLVLCYLTLWVHRTVRGKSLKYALDLYYKDSILLDDFAQRCAFWYFLYDSPFAAKSLKKALPFFVAEALFKANTPLDAEPADTIFSQKELSVRNICGQILVSREGGKVSLHGDAPLVAHVWDRFHACSGFSRESGLNPTLFFKELTEKYEHCAAPSQALLYDRYRKVRHPLQLDFFSENSIDSLLLCSLKNAVIFHNQLSLFSQMPLYSRVNMFTLFEELFQQKLSFWDTTTKTAEEIKKKLLTGAHGSFKRILELISFEVLGCLVSTPRVSHLMPKCPVTNYAASSRLSDSAADFQRARVSPVFKNVSFISGMSALLATVSRDTQPLTSPAIPSQIAARQMSILVWKALREECLQEVTADAAALRLYQELEPCIDNK